MSTPLVETAVLVRSSDETGARWLGTLAGEPVLVYFEDWKAGGSKFSAVIEFNSSGKPAGHFVHTDGKFGPERSLVPGTTYTFSGDNGAMHFQFVMEWMGTPSGSPVKVSRKQTPSAAAPQTA